MQEQIEQAARVCHEANRAYCQICEDVKGVRTPVYKLKRRLMWRKHGIKIVEI